MKMIHSTKGQNQFTNPSNSGVGFLESDLAIIAWFPFVAVTLPGLGLNGHCKTVLVHYIKIKKIAQVSSHFTMVVDLSKNTRNSI